MVKTVFFSKSIAAVFCCLLATQVQAQGAAAPERGAADSGVQNGVTAFFYRNPVVLDRQRHRDLRIGPGNASFAAKSQAVPLVASEFADASLEYPIVFSRSADGQWTAMALTGAQPNRNAFVDAQGLWGGRYVPASLRRYPFILAKGEGGQFSVAIDLAATNVGKTGEPVFNDKGEPAPLVAGVMPLLIEFQQQAELTGRWLKQFEEAGLLTPKTLQMGAAQGAQGAIGGIWVVDEAKLGALPTDTLSGWFKSGQIGAIYAHLISLRNLAPLGERSRSHAAAVQNSTTVPQKDKPSS